MESFIAIVVIVLTAGGLVAMGLCHQKVINDMYKKHNDRQE